MDLVHLHEVLAVDVVVCWGQIESTWRFVPHTLEEIDILAAVDALQPVCNFVFVPVPGLVSYYGQCAQMGLTYLTASGASYISENSDSVGEAKLEWSVRAFEAWLR
jgi:hypothetical protein